MWLSSPMRRHGWRHDSCASPLFHPPGFHQSWRQSRAAKDTLLTTVLGYPAAMRPAWGTKSGSRGRLQQRCCQGRIASSRSQRHTVLPLIVATRPRRRTSSAMSLVLSRDRGKPRTAGSSQARALTWRSVSHATWAPGKPCGFATGQAPRSQRQRDTYRMRLPSDVSSAS
jgi:hypothetical protein